MMSSNLNGSSEISRLSDGFNSSIASSWNMYTAKRSTSSMEMGLFPALHSMPLLGFAKHETMREHLEALLFLRVSLHLPHPWQLNAPKTPQK